MDAQTAMTITPLQGTLMGALLIVMWKLLDVAKTLFLKNKVPHDPVVANFACQQDPKYGDRLRRVDLRVQEIHNYTEAVQLQIAEGKFGCQWKDREEVRDYIDITRRQVEVMQSMIDEIRLLRQEMATTRNGKST